MIWHVSNDNELYLVSGGNKPCLVYWRLDSDGNVVYTKRKKK